ncbi:MAG: universal stress protein [Flavobacteriales bacterium]|nr:universal stress protein [Flavobacteriales bacterium]
MKNILAAIDFSPVTAKVLANAKSMASAYGAKLWIIHVADPEPDFIGFKTGPQYVRDHLAEQLRKEHVDLQDMASTCKQEGIDAEGLLVQGPTAETIVHEADRLKAEVVLVGSHGRSALFKAFVGSVSEQVIGECRVPVLVIPADRD